MNEAEVIDISRQAIQVALLVAAPLLIVSLITGLLISLFQVATSLQDVTLTFVPKILAVALVLMIAAHWMLRTLLAFIHELLAGLPHLIG